MSNYVAFTYLLLSINVWYYIHPIAF